MTIKILVGIVLIAVVNHGAVVTGEDQNGVVGYVEAIQCVHDFTDSPV